MGIHQFNPILFCRFPNSYLKIFVCLLPFMDSAYWVHKISAQAKNFWMELMRRMVQYYVAIFIQFIVDCTLHDESWSPGHLAPVHCDRTFTTAKPWIYRGCIIHSLVLPAPLFFWWQQRLHKQMAAFNDQVCHFKLITAQIMGTWHNLATINNSTAIYNSEMGKWHVSLYLFKRFYIWFFFFFFKLMAAYYFLSLYFI